MDSNARGAHAQRTKEQKFLIFLTVTFILFVIVSRGVDSFRKSYQTSVMTPKMQELAAKGVPAARLWIMLHDDSGSGMSDQRKNELKSLADNGDDQAKWYFGKYLVSVGEKELGEKYIQSASDQGEVDAVEYLAMKETKSKLPLLLLDQ